ncbi:MAG: hypothetical protein L3J29_12230 [Cyclobacteriaceae bacterium]|nr:hypothetical protein [Cyclobacteriaceae bacterium]
MKQITAILFFIAPSMAFAQFGVAYHQSNLPFVGINYEIGEKIRPEVRIGTDSFIEDISFEAVVTYDILNKQNFELYAGVGVRTEDFGGIVIPVGVNIYPFTFENFGFHIELAPILGDSQVLRGSWGIRYRFLKESTN